MSIAQYGFELKDVKGQGHKYTGSMMRPCDGGIEIANLLLELLAPLAALALKGELTPDYLVAGIQGQIAMFDQPMIEKLFIAVSRDGSLLDKDGINIAFAGNYREMYAALGEVVKANGFLPQQGSMLNASDLLNRTPDLTKPAPSSASGTGSEPTPQA